MVDIAYKRQQAGLTQAALAERVGVGRTAIANIEQGFNLPSVPVAMKIASELKFKWYKIYEE